MNRRKWLVLLLAVLLVLALSSCSDDGVGGTFEDRVTIQYDGNDLHCVRRGHGMSCDWVRYHQENPAE